MSESRGAANTKDPKTKTKTKTEKREMGGARKAAGRRG
jgi:hypothetical protein